MHPLSPVLRDYAWGSASDIPRMLGFAPTGGPIAEAWWGAHPQAPSPCDTPAGADTLDRVIERDPTGTLGGEAAERWGARLPYLLKILAIVKPLSLQVHPTLEQAAAGFASQGQQASAGPFTDASHKPEMIVALTPMVALAGVRPLDQVRADLNRLDTDGARRLTESLDEATDISAYVRTAMGGDMEATVAALADAGAAAAEHSAMHVAAAALAHHPGDSGALVALALNPVVLAPGESLYTGAQVIHSYQSGVGIEIMANSDNVVRAGLTPKPVDIPLLLDIARTYPSEPERPDVRERGGVATFSTPAAEFGLTTVRDGAVVLPRGPRIIVSVAGEATVVLDGTPHRLEHGASAFVPASDGDVEVSTSGLAAVAHTADGAP